MEKIILVAHGSRKAESINMNVIANSVHRLLHPTCTRSCVKFAFLQFTRPDLSSTIEECIIEGAKTIIIHPFFLSFGRHVTEDIPEIVETFEKKFPQIKFLITQPIGTHEYVLKAIWARIKETKIVTGLDIEKQSMNMIDMESSLDLFSQNEKTVVKRVIHATADIELGNSMLFHPDAVMAGVEAIRQAAPILTDAMMVKAGFNKEKIRKFGLKVVCAMEFLKDSEAPQEGTRSELAIKKAAKQHPSWGIIVVGNSPTALLKVMELMDRGYLHCRLLVGVPVGFVKAFESKSLLFKKPYPYITNLHNKGGSSMAVAIINALFALAEKDG
ncbi:MAG: precorrin-8X methylmutase [Deltaproteobacteria bacterium]|nr:precorrin-8X methylmutase [Deltaproteobacteria bacterium]